MTQSEFPLSSAISPLPDDIFYSVIKTILYVIHLYGKVAFVESLLYVGRSAMKIQHALYRKHMSMGKTMYFEDNKSVPVVPWNFSYSTEF